MAEDSHPTYLPPSELGTKDYWETFYARTLSHLSSKHDRPSSTDNNDNDTNPDTGDNNDSDNDSDDSDDSDPGTSWFSEHNAPRKVHDFLTSEEFPLAPVNLNANSHSHPSILDLGTGNGSMLSLLRKKGGFKGLMVGVDYSARSVELARRLWGERVVGRREDESDSEDEDEDEGGDGDEGGRRGEAETRFEEWDILSCEDEDKDGADSGSSLNKLDWFPSAQGGFDIVLDKGTFDAVSLSDEVVDVAASNGSGSGKKIERRVCERYPVVARRLVRKGGFLVVTSCNWTEEELVRWFTSTSTSTSTSSSGDGDGDDRLVVWGRVEYPRFRFGGMEGQGVCTVCFQRVKPE